MDARALSADFRSAADLVLHFLSYSSKYIADSHSSDLLLKPTRHDDLPLFGRRLAELLLDGSLEQYAAQYEGVSIAIPFERPTKSCVVVGGSHY